MGVGTPWNILECIGLGVDMFDCVMPTRNGRNAMLFTTKGIINIDNKKWERDFSPIDDGLDSEVGHYYNKAYVRHLFKAGEILGLTIASLQNLAFSCSTASTVSGLASSQPGKAFTADRPASSFITNSMSFIGAT